jgi:hypothetical protein
MVSTTVIGELVHPFTDEVAEIDAVAFEVVLFIVENEGMLPLPLDASPIALFVLSHEIVEPEILLLNEIAVELSPAQIV